MVASLVLFGFKVSSHLFRELHKNKYFQHTPSREGYSRKPRNELAKTEPNCKVHDARKQHTSEYLNNSGLNLTCFSDYKISQQGRGEYQPVGELRRHPHRSSVTLCVNQVRHQQSGGTQADGQVN